LFGLKNVGFIVVFLLLKLEKENLLNFLFFIFLKKYTSPFVSKQAVL